MKHLTLLLAFLVSGCFWSRPCITPPPMATSDQNSMAASVSAQLAALPVGGSFSGSYSNIVTNSYDKLGDNDKSLYLFLLAIDCFLDDGKIGQDIAKQMAKLIMAKWSEREPKSREFSAFRGTISRSDKSAEILAMLKKIGVAD